MVLLQRCSTIRQGRSVVTNPPCSNSTPLGQTIMVVTTTPSIIKSYWPGLKVK